MSVSIPKRTSRAEQTKAKILAAAKKYFSLRSFEQVGLREIAAEAGIDVALINRYFGSKRKLFEKVIDDTYGAAGSKAGGGWYTRENIGQILAQHLLKMQDNPVAAARNTLFLQSITSPVASEIIAPRFYDCFVKQIESVMVGQSAKMKAELITSLVIGSSAIFSLFKRDIQQDYDVEQFLQVFAQMIDAVG